MRYVGDGMNPKLLETLKSVLGGFDYHPGISDLDNEQPITVRMTLGEYRAIFAAVMKAERSGGVAKA